MKTRCDELSVLEQHLRAGAERLADGEGLLLRKLDENADLQAVLRAKNQVACSLACLLRLFCGAACRRWCSACGC
eukprot:1524797-Rhodomonas_salina.2